jgi:hypothetical protein
MVIRGSIEGGWQSLDEIVHILGMAAGRLWDEADNAGIDSPLHSLALGAFLAASRATQMLPAGRTAPETSASVAGDPLPLLETAEQLTRQLDPQMSGVAELSAAVLELVREARSHAA